ncbi:VOC family protein [Pedobacter gandavensis]|uniref:VOC family protein n=1 Tax=Pedobacter gandavensis TaxID=2679963 RepID=A0ABR6EZT7_9SPHI|nr:VOC family protein [Pedobacter gandavensis]MBB2150803.1 VOC family protein [Pedobacter gandavensis]
MKLFTLILVFTLACHPFQDSIAQTSQKMTPALLNHIAVYVTDLEKSTDFYKNTFGFNQIPEPFHDGKHTWFSLGAAGQLHLIKGAKGKGSFDKNEHLCFSVASIDPFIERLKKQNIAYENWAGMAQSVTLRVDGIKQIYFQDPDGHWLEVNDDQK